MFTILTVECAIDRLSDMGFAIGIRLLEHISWKDKTTKRETKFVKLLFFITMNVWKALFGREAVLEKSSDTQYMISEPEMLVSKFISPPKAHPNSNAFIAGIVEGILDAAEFPARVTAPNTSAAANAANAAQGKAPKAFILIEFAPEVLEEDAKHA